LASPPNYAKTFVSLADPGIANSNFTLLLWAKLSVNGSETNPLVCMGKSGATSVRLLCLVV
jgi:hypothetical protein